MSALDVENKLMPDGQTLTVSKESGHRVEWVTEENYMFRLSEFSEQLTHWLQQDGTAITFRHPHVWHVPVYTSHWHVSICVLNHGVCLTYERIICMFLSSVIEPAVYAPDVQHFVRHRLQDLSVSRQRSRLSWGIPVPNDDTQTVRTRAPIHGNRSHT